jgi:hypothetical protein
MKSIILVSGVLLIYALSGCSPNNDDRTRTSETAEPQHIFKDQVNALDKAKGLEQDMNKAFEQRNLEMEDQAQ